MSKRILSLFMALVLCVSMLPTSVFARVDSTLETVEAITEVEAVEKEEPAAEDPEDPSTEESDAGKELSPRSEKLDETASLAALEPVEYIGKDGSKATCQDYTLLTGDPAENTLDGTNGEVWYVLSGSISATADWIVYGNVSIILADGASCNTDGHCIDLKDKAVLTVYGQEKGTGLLSIYSTAAERSFISALGGPSPVIEDDKGSAYWRVELGSLALYGGNLSVESAEYTAVKLDTLTVMGGTLTAKAAESHSAIHLKDEVLPTLAENYKICKADAPQETVSHSNGSGIKVLITECTEHDFGYAASETSGMHKVACKLCSVFREEAHDFSFGGESCDDGMKHFRTCVCGAKSVTAEYHNLVCTPNNDTLTHSTVCSVCGYEREDIRNEEHDFTSDKALCSDCGFKRGASIKIGDTLINREKFVDALDLAMGKSGSSTDGIVTVYGDEECFPGTQIDVKWGKFTIDLNGAELAFPGITLFDINRNANVTIKNGKLNLAGNTTYSDNPGIMDRSGGLTLEDVEITASCCTRDGHVQYPAVKVLFNFSNPKTFTAKNVIFNGGFEARGGASITPFTSGSFVYSCPEATHENPVIKVGQNITDIIADGYALAKYDDNTQLVSMYQYDETGARVDLHEIWESVTVVPHPEHTFTNGVCGCGYRCEHAGGFDADGICQSCGAHAVASVGDEMFTQLDVAFARANELSASTGENIKINILYDLGDIAGSGTATEKITLDLNGHDLRKCQFFVGKKDESGNVTAEGDLTILDSAELTNGQIDKVTLYGGKLSVTDGYSMDIDVYGGEAFVTDHIAENIRVYGGTANLTKGSANDISVYKGELNISGSAINRLSVNSDGKTHIFDGKITKATLRGGETTISDGKITDTTLSGGELYITNGLLSNLLVNGGKANISNDSHGTSIPTFEMKAGEVLIEGGNFDDFTVNITNADNTNPKLEIEDGTFGRTSFSALTKGRIVLYGGTFDSVEIDVLPGSTVRTFGDILAENYMFYKVSDRSLIPNSTDKIDESAEVKRHRHVYTEKSNADGSYYGECACGYKAEAVLEKSDSSKTYYDTFEQAAAAVSSGNTLKLCFDVSCENDVTIEQKGAYRSHVTLNLNGKKLSFDDGKKLSLLYSYIDVTDSDSGSGYVSHLYANASSTQLYGGTYGTLQSDNENLLKNLRGNGCGFKSLATGEWITSFGWASSLTDITVKPAPYTVKAVVTNTPDGTETPAVIYAGQTLYFKLLFTMEDGIPPISESNPARSSINYSSANGKYFVVGTNRPITSDSAFATKTLAEDAAEGTYTAQFMYIEYYGCVQEIELPFEVKICTHDSYTDGICDTCSMSCKHTDVAEDGKCGTCKTEFSLQLITKDGASSYYTAFKDALMAASLEENKGCTVKLFKEVTMTQAEQRITLNGGEFTLDLNGYTVNAEARTDPTHSMLYISLTNVDMTLKSSTVRNTYTSFYPIIQIYDGTVFKSSHDFTDSYLHIDEINFVQTNTTSKVSLGTGVYVVNLHKANDQMTSGDVLEDGCVFRTSYGNTIIPRSDTSTIIFKMFVIQCPHDWNGNTCNYCGLICNHESGFDENGICPVCGKACEHKNLDESYYCPDCQRQMVVKLETASGTVTYSADLRTALETAENGTTVTLLANATLSDKLFIYGDGKTVTLDLNGHSIDANSWYTIEIGATSEHDADEKGTLAIVGKGDIQPTVIVSPSGTLDLTNWVDGTIRYLAVKNNSHVNGCLANEARIDKLVLSAFTKEKTDEIFLSGGSYGEIGWNNFIGLELPLGSLLAPGYAFRRDDQTFVPYAEKLAAIASLYNVTVVKCTEHADSDGDGKCDYCNGQLVARVDVKNGGSHVYTDFQDAVDSIAARGVHTVTLLADAPGSYTITKGRGTTIKLNGKTVNEITVSGESNMAFNDSGTVNSVIFSGNAARLSAGNQLFTISAITVKDGATWSSILPNPELHGYQVYNSDKSSYKWYDAGMLEEFLGDGNTINNVKVQQLPVTKDPILMIDGQEIAEQSSISVYKTFVFSFESYVTNGTGGSGVLFIQKDGDSAPTPVSADGDWKIFTCPERTFDILQSGTYTIWAEVSKQGYTRRSKTYTLNVGADLQDAEITLKQSDFTYTPVPSAGATEFTAEIKSVRLFGHDVPADAYTVSGETTGTDARTYTITITANEGDYIGSKTVNWTIHPRVLTEVGVGTYIKKYDGTTEITVDNIGKNDSPPHFFYDGCPAGGIVLTYDEDYKIRDLNANFSYPNAGEYADVSFKVELKNSNYTFKDNDDNDTKYKTVDTGMYIDKADLPTGYAPGAGGVTVRNGVAHTYTYDVSALLKQLPTGLSYGTKSYTVASTYIMDGGYIDDGSVSIDGNGILSIPVKKVLTLADAEVARITVTVQAQNYADFTVTVTVYARNQIVPTGNPTLSDNGAITFGDKISKIQLSGKLYDDINNTEVEGTFAWENPNAEPSGAGDYEAAWVFTPTGDNAYLYGVAAGKATIKVNKAPLTEGVDYEKPTAITGLVYKVNDNTPQTLHTSGRVIGTVGTMKYTTADPENAATVWSDTPLTSRDAGEFVVYYKVFGDENHLDSAYGTISCRIAKYKLVYKIVCLPKVYDGTKNGDPKNIASITFLDADSKTVKVDLTEKDYTVESITYDSENVGENLGTVPVRATASVKLNATKTASNYELVKDGNNAYGCITPARIENVDFHGYTYKVLYINTYAKTATVSSFGDVDRADYEIVSDMVSTGDSRILRTISCETTGITFAIADGLSVNDVGKSYTIKVRIYTKDHNYCTDELPFTVEIVDKDRPTLSVDPIEVNYNGKAVPDSSINGTATVNRSRIDGTWSFKDGKAPTTVAESGDYTVVFTPAYPDYYYGGEKTVHVTVKPKAIDDADIVFAYPDSAAYTGNAITPTVSAKFGNDPLKLGEDKDYTVTYPADATNIGEKKMTVTGHGNFGGTKELAYTITPCTVIPTITLSKEEYIYGDDEKKPTVTVTVEGRTLVEGKDFDVAYSNNINAEDGAKVTVTAKGNYGFEKQEKFFHIGKADSVIEAAPEAAPFIYDGESHGLVTAGSAKGGTFEYKLGDGSWTKEIPMAKDAAEYTVWYRVVGDGNHNDTAESSVSVSVEKRDIADAKIVLGPSLTYNRKVQEQTVLRVVFESALNATFNVAGNHATDAGTYTLTVTGTGNFKGTRDIDFTIAKKEVTASVAVGGTYVYNGKEITPTDITVKDGEDIIPNTEYTVKGFENNKDAGMAKVIIVNAEGGNYVVNGTGEFRIEKANITVRPKDISKVYGSEPEFELESDSDLITEEELAAFASTARFTSKGAEKTAKVLDGGYEITAELTGNETDNLILAVSGTGTLTVLPAKLTIKVNDVSRIYGEPNPALSVSYNGFVNGEDESVLNGTLVLAYSESINETTAVGTYENVTTASGLTSGNYDITYVPGNVTITKIPVRASAGTARRAYLNVVLDKSLEGLTEANFVVKDSKGNVVAVTSVNALPGNTTYSLKGVFEVGEKHTVKVVLSGAAVDATHQMTTDEFEITPIRTSGGTSGGSGNSGSAATTFTVTFDTNGGSELAAQTVTKNSVIEEPQTPTKEGFEFAGWYTDKELQTKYDFSTSVTTSMTLYAAWTEIKKDNSENQIILTIGEKAALVFGQIKTNDVAPKIVNDRTMLPARFVAENLGAEVSWNEEKELVTIKGKNSKTNEDITILIYIGSDIAYVNDKRVKLDSSAFVENDRTYTPIRFISEELGASVEWIESEQKVVITK